jgi:hypothetical protein
MLRNAVKAFLARTRRYFRENRGAPFILSFMLLLLLAAGLMAMGLPWSAEVIGSFAYFSLVVGVVLQLLCLWRTSNERNECHDE